MRNTGLEEVQAGIKIAGRNINNLSYAGDTTLMAESEEELKNLLMKVKEESEKVGLQLNTQKTKIMASGPIISWEIDGEAVETVSDFIFWGSKITADDFADLCRFCRFLQIWFHHFMGNRWRNSTNSVRLYFLGGSKITADDFADLCRFCRFLQICRFCR